MLRQDLFDEVIAECRGYYAQLSDALRNHLHAGNEIDEEALADTETLRHIFTILEFYGGIRGMIPKDLVLMGVLCLRAAVLMKAHYEECEGCVERAKQSADFDARMETEVNIGDVSIEDVETLLDMLRKKENNDGDS